jgi:solute carrier family 25 phosphate transporter 23/24/25/41
MVSLKKESFFSELIFAVAISLTGELGIKELLACAWLSSSAGQLLAYPFHLVKTRMITKSGHYRNVIDVFRKTVVTEGIRGLYRGILPSFIKSVPSHGITFLVYEYFKR